MPVIRIVFLWHQHQPYYKDLVSGEYRLPWVRLHALKDYYGMVKLLDEFPEVHQTFNLVPSMLLQLQDYVSGGARDPFFDVAIMPARELSADQRVFALKYLFQANVANMIGRYSRLRELHERVVSFQGDLERGAETFTEQDLTDLQVLSQLAWFDEYFIETDAEVRALVEKGKGYSRADQQRMEALQRKILAAVIPAHAEAAARGSIEIATSPFYHPILPLLCDTDAGKISNPSLTLPLKRFARPEDAALQLQRALDFHAKHLGSRPTGVWPSEGSVSEEVIRIAARQGVRWMATDEGVLGRSIRTYFERSREGVLSPESAQQLYTIYRYQKDETAMHMIFRDHSLSDLIGFVYSGMSPQDAARHFIDRVKTCAGPLIAAGRDAVVPVILDGENAWEYFPKSGREFLRRLYAALTEDAQIECCTVSEAIAKHDPQRFAPLTSITPGSWINSNFDIWIGAPEDNRSWNYLQDARQAFDAHERDVSADKRALALEELLIAEGSDWNWWYGPEHHTANDRDFDELYRKHLSNIYQALDLTPPTYLAQPIISSPSRAHFVEQTAFIHPLLDGGTVGYFDWLGAAHFAADTRSSAMHGKKFLMEAVYAGINERDIFFRLDFAADAFDEDDKEEERLLPGEYDIGVQLDREMAADSSIAESIRLDLKWSDGRLSEAQSAPPVENEKDFSVRMGKVLEGRVALDALHARIGDSIRLRFSIWQNGLPIDAVPNEGAISIRVVSEQDMASYASGELWKA